MSAPLPEEEGGRRVEHTAAAVFVFSLSALLIGTGLWAGGRLPWTEESPPAASAPVSEHSGERSPRSPSSPPPASTPAGSTGPSGPVEPAESSLGRAEPVSLSVPAIDVGTEDLLPLAVRSDGELEVPQDAEAVGWYEAGAWPGQKGAAVMGAHVDSRTGPGVFFRLRELSPGDEITVGRADGAEAVFSVYEVEKYPKDEFPTRRVYGSTQGRAELRLITCGGAFEASRRGYTSNVVVYAALESAD